MKAELQAEISNTLLSLPQRFGLYLLVGLAGTAAVITLEAITQTPPAQTSPAQVPARSSPVHMKDELIARGAQIRPNGMVGSVDETVALGITKEWIVNAKVYDSDNRQIGEIATVITRNGSKWAVIETDFLGQDNSLEIPLDKLHPMAGASRAAFIFDTSQKMQ